MVDGAMMRSVCPEGNVLMDSSAGAVSSLNVGFMLIYNLELIKCRFGTEYQFKVLWIAYKALR